MDGDVNDVILLNIRDIKGIVNTTNVKRNNAFYLFSKATATGRKSYLQTL